MLHPGDEIVLACGGLIALFVVVIIVKALIGDYLARKRSEGKKPLL